MNNLIKIGNKVLEEISNNTFIDRETDTLYWLDDNGVLWENVDF